MAQDQKKIKKTDDKTEQTQKGADSQLKKKKVDEKPKADLDKLIDEIDDVLEENAEEFVQNYVQRGGQ